MRKYYSPPVVGGFAVVVLTGIALVAAISIPGCGFPGSGPKPTSSSGAQGQSDPSSSSAVRPISSPSANSIPPLPMGSAKLATRFVGSEACRDCHAKEFEAHGHSPHAKTLTRISGETLLAPFRSKQKVVDPTRKATYSVAVKDGKPMMRVELEDGRSMELEPRYAVGSGTNGYTYLIEDAEAKLFLEGRISYFSGPKKWDWTPGAKPPRPDDEVPIGRIISNETSLRCFMCHSTVMVVEGEQVMPEASMFNVGCERCHGPGREHIEAAKAGQKGTEIYGFKNASGELMIKFCSECHRGPGAIPDRLISTSPMTPRFVGTALAASECFKQTPGGLSCMKCHDPHAPSQKDPKHYERVCMDCHSGKTLKSKVCSVNPRSGCIPCHMPRTVMENTPFHNHWIHAYRDAASALANKKAH